ncbi:unnamed protein product [Nippostrongylus brasiliensis]|uniref:Receptor-mediated endocytosis protein 6 n=1 Tax=Nippostrongylus brasiliensis TaxID=27835 RepID=A0A0N4XSZ4_NIPBR|nr:unnamed protein product [Nippostrongylus brasiliensis]
MFYSQHPPACDISSDHVGLVSEEKYMETLGVGGGSKKHARGGTQKRTRFVDTGSTDRTPDNASDLEEDAAEQQEVGSISSSLEAPQEDRMLLLDEDGASTIPDNVSDVDETEMADLGAVSTAAGSETDRAQRVLPSGVPVAVRKQNAEGLEEKFGKFTVPTSQQNRRDDQRSLLSDSWSTNVVPSDDEGPSLPQLPSADAADGGSQRGRGVNRTGSLCGAGGATEDRSDTWSLDAIASDSEADGGRERSRQVADIGYDMPPRAGRNGSADASVSHIAVPCVSVQPLVEGSHPGESGARLRRHSSGSSFSYSRSEADSELSKEDRERAVPTDSLSANCVLPQKQHSSDQPGPSGACASSFSSPSHSSVVGSSHEAEQYYGPSSPSSNGRKKLALLQQGLLKVGDKVRKDLDQRSADDILAKYQPSTAQYGDEAHAPVELASSASESAPSEQVITYYSPDNLTECRAFLDTKRKLRLVLSSVGNLPSMQFDASNRGVKLENEREQLVMLLRTLLAEAVNSREQSLVAHTREVMRCLQIFDNKGQSGLNDIVFQNPQAVTHTTRGESQALVLFTLSTTIQNNSTALEKEKALVEECLVEVLVRFYLENKDQQMKRFLQEFVVLNAQDEKTDCLLRTLSGMYSRLPVSSMWQSAPAHLIAYARKTIERVFMAQIHALAFYPNLDADRHRDELFSKSLARLARSFHPSHPMLRIPSVLHGEAPWPSAQAEISIINAYKSARDKLACVVRCCETISNLISMAPGMGAAAADDVTPVLVYVLIQANPPSLLSNVQYVQGFGGSLLDGAEGYWWTQFTAAIEFVKTLL